MRSHSLLSRKERIEMIAERLAISPELRIPRTDVAFCKQIRISTVTYMTDKKAIEAEWAKPETPDEVSKYMARLEALAMSGKNPRYMEMLLKIKNIYKDKSEVKIELNLTADQFIRRNLRAESELTDEGYRVEKVSSESNLLS